MVFRIREAREQCGLTQSALADMLGLNGVTLSGYETGKHDPKSDTLVKIAQICGVSVDFLLGREKSEKKQLSEKAMKVARAYDAMSDYGRAIIDAVLDQEEKMYNHKRPGVICGGAKSTKDQIADYESSIHEKDF